MPSVHLAGVAFAHGDDPPLFSDLELRLDPGWTGLAGENGTGKTTLLRLITGDLDPTAGRIRRDGTVALCPQLAETCTDAIRALADRTDGVAAEWRGRLDLDPDALRRWPTLSGGERKRWQIGAALVEEPDVLLVDEPTNHLDAEARDLLIGALLGFAGVGVVVSHDRTLLDLLTSRTVRLHDGQATVWPGSWSEAEAAWKLAERATFDAHQDAVRQVRAADRRLADARRTRDAADAARARKPRNAEERSMGFKNLVAWAEDRAGRTVGVRRQQAERARAELAEHAPVRDLGRAVFVGYAPSRRPWIATLDRPELRAGDRILARDVRLALGRTDRVRIAGPNGAGKSTLLRAMAEAAGDAPVLFLPQELDRDDVVRLRDEVRALPNEVRGRVMALVAALGAEPARVVASPSPSAGEARKLALALGLGRHVHALLLDEPTNHLDLPSIERLEAALVAFPGAILLVTHDDRLAGACTDVRWRFAEGTVLPA